MYSKFSRILIVGIAYGIFAAADGFATPPESAVSSQLEALQQSVSKLTNLVEAQQIRIKELESKLSKPADEFASVPPASSSHTSRVPSSTSSSQYLPDVGVVGDIVVSSTESKEDEEGNDRFSLRELELVFGHDVDPYTRFDATITFSDQEDPDVEEAYATYFGLPADAKARFGRMHQRIGKASAMHRDSLDTVDEPFVVQRYFGPEGLFRTGVEFSKFIPWPTDSYTQELVLGSMEGGVGEEGELFGETRRALSYYAHLVNFQEISDSTSFELGGTYLLGSQDEDSAPEVHAFGVDATFIHKPDAVQRVKVQGETYIQNRDELELVNESEAISFNQNPFGFYLLADYRFAERWGTGFRYDYVEPSADDESVRSAEEGYTGYLTFFQSEFVRWRFQYQHALPLDGEFDERFFLQGTFAIGTHKHYLN